MSKNRKKSHKAESNARIDALYTRDRIRIGHDKCVYCDELSDKMNRVISPSLVGKMTAAELDRYKDGIRMVASCNSCASAAQELLFLNVDEKKSYIADFFDLERGKANTLLMSLVQDRTINFLDRYADRMAAEEQTARLVE